jgi:glycine cleavage system H protein
MDVTETHEWIKEQNGIATVGMTKQAMKELGEVVFIELPKVGAQIELQQQIVVIESTKAAIDIYSPVAGEIIEVNTRLIAEPDLLNQSPEEEGWLFKVLLCVNTQR